jgi:hypothetical protein
MGSIESVSRMSNGPILVVSALMEIGAGLILLAVPVMAISLVFDFPGGGGAGVVLGRFAGAALLAIGAACWWARHDNASAASRALVSGLLIYNAAIVGLVITSSLGSPGVMLWAIAALHGAMAVWCMWSLRIAWRSAVIARNLIAIGAFLDLGGAALGPAIPAQTPESFTLAVPLQVDIMTNVAVR